MADCPCRKPSNSPDSEQGLILCVCINKNTWWIVTIFRAEFPPNSARLKMKMCASFGSDSGCGAWKGNFFGEVSSFRWCESMSKKVIQMFGVFRSAKMWRLCKTLKNYLLSKHLYIDKGKTLPIPFSIFQLGKEKGHIFPTPPLWNILFDKLPAYFLRISAKESRTVKYSLLFLFSFRNSCIW